MISHQYRFIHFHIPRTGGSSVRDALWRYREDEKAGLHPKDHPDFYGEYDWHLYGFNPVNGPCRIGGGTSETEHIGYEIHNYVVNFLAQDSQPYSLSYGKEKFNEYFKFCVIRNPYDKMVSWYHWYIFTNKIPPNYPFNHFCRFCKINNFYIHGIDGESVCDYFIRFENLEEDIIKLCNKLGIKDYDIDVLPKHKSGVRPKDSGYREYYDEITRKLVYKNHKEEFELFGYEF